MFARSASTRRTWTPFWSLVIGLSLVVAATFGPPAATAGDPGRSGDAPYRGRVISLMQHMTLQQKVGQLFVIEVAGRHATTVSDAAKAVNQRLYGVDTAAWEHVAAYEIRAALPSQAPPMGRFRKAVRLEPGLYVCGDHRDSASIQGALVSGRRAAQAVLRELRA